ncbi:MAG: hypothetical protein BM555_03535 [Crocinitomix sp. MedPE-SWsnd]|nr:MAG: hypothetical protein BM555_03535 [Crocinitomix sp. MedPE-SWsnd]
MKNFYMKKVTLLSLGLLAIGAIAQTTVQHDHSHNQAVSHECENNVEMKKVFLQNPELEAQHIIDQANFENEYQQFLQDYDPYARSSYTVPVVVHVVHENGSENISDEQIYDAILRINEDFTMTNDDGSNTIPAFTSIIGNADVEFVLATRDPSGNCHKGITRTYVAGAGEHDVGDNGDVRTAVQSAHGNWPQNKYMNIFIVKKFTSTGGGITLGYTNTPGNWYNQSGMGGSIYMDNTAVGSIGTSTSSYRHVLSHEVGHWLNLSHTWGGSNSPGEAANCGDDDGVTDTPNCEGSFSCNTSSNTCGSLDNVQNVMDYAGCRTMFTQGQAARVQTALNSSTAGRNNLWTASNLAATGTDAPGDICEAEFSSNYKYICAGQSVDFYDESFHNVQTRSWIFTGGTPATSSDENPVITYNTPGVYPVSLTVSDGSNDVSSTENNFVIVLADPGKSLPYSEGFETISNIPDDENWMIVDQAGSDPWILTSTAGSQGSQKSAKLLNYNNSESSDDELISGTIDLSGVDPSDDMIFTFDYAYRKRTSSNDEWLKFYISKDCGETWVLRKNIHDDDLSSVTASSSYTPAGDDDWYTVDITNISSSYYEADFRFKFVFESDNGNNIYIDNINMYPSSMSDVVEKKEATTLNVYPNPVTDITNIQLSAVDGQDYNVSVLNGMGQQVASIYQGTLAKGLNNFEYNTSELAKGIYIVRIESEGNVQTVKLIKK